MRKFGLAILAVMLMAATFGGNSLTFTDSSQRYEIAISQSVYGAGFLYNVRITDIVSHYIMKQWDLATKIGAPLDVTSYETNPQFKLRLDPSADGLRARLTITSMEGKLLDSFDTWWDTTAGVPISSVGVPVVGGDVHAPHVVNRVEPKYTDAARQDRIAGMLIARLLIDKTGTVRQISIVKTLPDGLSDSAIDALRQWTWSPATRDGQPVDALFNVTVNFKPGV